MVPTYLPTYLKCHHHWAAVLSRGWAKASACRLQVSLSCAVLCQIVYLSIHGFPCRRFVSYGLQVATRQVHRSSAVGVSCPGPFNPIVFTLLIMSMTYVLSLTQMLLLLYVHVMLSMILSILLCAAAGLFCSYLVSVHVSVPYRAMS